MSGGVDSSVAAALLQRAGYDVTGVFMCLGRSADGRGDSPIDLGGSPGPGQGCCSPQDAADARRVAELLGIRLETIDLAAEMELIIRYFLEEYRRGRTPNPCVLCNARLKFGRLVELAEVLDIPDVATGHYARLLERDGRRWLCRAVDLSKDQSYGLFAVGSDRLARILLPNGELRKQEVRALAAELHLPVHDKPESQEICFVPDDDYPRFLAARCPELSRPGPVVDTSGRVLGEHQGIFRYTIGQRRGLGMALGSPAYVVRIDALANTITLGGREELLGTRLLATGVNWLDGEWAGKDSFAASVQIRYNHRGVPATVQPLADSVQVDFEEPVSAITPGQAAVIYRDDRVIGGGWIV